MRPAHEETFRRRSNRVRACIGEVGLRGGMLVGIASLADLRVLIGKSSDVGRFEPRPSAAQQEGEERLTKVRCCSS